MAPRPNLLVIWGDDTGMTDSSAHAIGPMGCPTPDDR
jgi:arylsulfatase A-like enzyme